MGKNPFSRKPETKNIEPAAAAPAPAEVAEPKRKNPLDCPEGSCTQKINHAGPHD